MKTRDHNSWGINDPRGTYDDHVEINQDFGESTRMQYARGEQDSFLRDEAEDVLSWYQFGIKLPSSSPSWPRLRRALQEAVIGAHEGIASRNDGRIIPTPPSAHKTSTSQAPERAATSSGHPLSELFNQRKREAERTGEWSSKLIDDYKAWTEMFIEVSGDKPIGDYAKQEARDFKEILMGLPSNRQKFQATKGKSAIECVKIPEELGLQCLSVATINKALGRMQSTWNWANKQLDNELSEPVAI